MSDLGRAPDPALVERFARDVARIRPLAAGERIAIAVSGGPDSMALLALAAAAFPGRVVAATVDHRLRPEAADEARMVADWCAGHAIAHAISVVEDAIGSSAVQARARDRRYALLQRWAAEAQAACLATAHHADDQAETFLMRASRGSGVAGLAGIRALQAGGEAQVDVIRPLLGWRVAELRALAVAAKLPFIDDPSNHDPHYDRTRFRALLRGTPWLDPVQLARSAAYAAEADATLREIEAWSWRQRATIGHPGALDEARDSLVPGSTVPRVLRSGSVRAGGPRDEPGVTGEGAARPKAPLSAQVRLDISDLPRELRRRLSRRAIHTVRSHAAITQPAFDDSTNIEPLLDSLAAGRTATQAGVIVRVHENVWRFAAQPPRRAT